MILFICVAESGDVLLFCDAEICQRGGDVENGVLQTWMVWQAFVTFVTWQAHEKSGLWLTVCMWRKDLCRMYPLGKVVTESQEWSGCSLFRTPQQA